MSDVSVTCPRCRGALVGSRCQGCHADYAGPLGIVDLCAGEPLTATAQDVVAHAESESLEQLVARRTAPRRGGRSARVVEVVRWYTETAVERSERMIAMLSTAVEATTGAPLSGKVALDLGCGVGAAIGALARRFDRVVGVDLHLENLTIAARRVREAKLDNVTLVRTGAGALPIADQSLDAVVAINVLEHLVDDLDDVLREVHRVLGPGGVFCADSRNRYDLFFREPHVQLRLVGYLPRALQAPYVKWRSGRSYGSVRLLSPVETRSKVARHVGPAHLRMSSPSAWGKPSGADRAVAAIDGLPGFGSIARAVYPSLVVVARRR